MAVIRFSHAYPKLHGQKRATLVAVRSIRIDENTPKELLEYDTAYDGGHFPLPYGDYKQLVFVGDKGIPFCTIREHYPAEKGDYYDGSLGDVFEIKIKSEKEVAEQNPVKREPQSNDNMAKLRKALERAKEKAIYIVRNYRKPLSLTGNILELLAYQNEAIKALDALATPNNNACKTKILSLDEAIEHAQSCIDETPCGQNHKQLAEWLLELDRLKTTPAGNIYILRTALVKAYTMLKVCDWAEGVDMNGVADLMKEIESAIDAPLRNCDLPRVRDIRESNAYLDSGGVTKVRQ